jgi:hypothetical protein
MQQCEQPEGEETMSVAIISPRVRSKIVKIPDTSPGLLFLNGQQKQFTLEGVWKSPVAPAANMTVDVDLDDAGSIAAITVVDTKEVAGQKVNQVLQQLKAHAIRIGKMSLPALRSLTSSMGPVMLGAAVLLWISWFFFTAGTVDVGGGQVSYSFWGLLGVDFNNPETLENGGSHGFFSLLSVLCIALPFAAAFLRGTWAKYLNAAPFLAFLIGFIGIVMNEHKAFGDLSKMGAPNPFSWSFILVFLVLSSIVLGLGALKKPSAH